MLVYTVIAELPTAALAQEFLDWLEDDHLGDVVRAGAVDGEAVLLDRDGPDANDGDRHVVECRYRFASREAFAAYEAGPAEALRAEGRARFGPERGITMSRRIGEARVSRG